MGYLVAVIIEYITIVLHFVFLASMAAFGVANFFFALSFTEDVKIDLKKINDGYGKLKQNHLQTSNLISHFIRFHSTSKR